MKFSLLLISLTVKIMAQTTIYCFPGQGSDNRIFDSLIIDSAYAIKVVEYDTPEKHATMSSFARQLSARIDTTQPFILLGFSLGGMICAELSEILNPRKTILISSAKNRSELPLRYRFQKSIPLYRLFPGFILLSGAKLLQPIVEPDRNKNKKTFKSMLAAKNPTYMKRTIGLIISWQRKHNTKKLIHIHGTKDHTIPIRNIKTVDHVVEKGSHMMTLTRAKEISIILNSVLKQ